MPEGVLLEQYNFGFNHSTLPEIAPQTFNALAGNSCRIRIVFENLDTEPLVPAYLFDRHRYGAIINVTHPRAIKVGIIDVEMTYVFSSDGTDDVRNRRLAFRRHRLDVQMHLKVVEVKRQ